jgi:hypothetical protein
MAQVRLADINFDQDVYLSYLQENRTDRNAFVASGAAVTDSDLSARAQGAADVTSIPYWNDLSADNENLSSDDPAERAVPEKITTDRMVARRVHLNNAWETMNLVKAISGEDAMRQIASRTNAYWNERFAKRIQGITLGLYNDNAAGTGDMIVDVSTEDGDNATAANKWSFDAFADGIGTMGESDDVLALLAVHPSTYTQLIKQNNIEFEKDSESGIMIPFYNGKRVIKDKKLPVIAGGTSGSKFVSVLYGAGFIGYGEAQAERPVAVEYDELAGNGAGSEVLVERKQWLIHPAGYKWEEASVAGVSPTVAECQDATNWTRKFQRENIPLSFIVHN